MPIKEKDSLCQIPIEELQTMSTTELVIVLIDCRYARGIGKYSTTDKYYEEIYSNFNGLRELVIREDIGRKMIDYYKDMHIQNEDLSSAGLSMKEQLQTLEYLIVCPKILERFKPEEFDELFSNLKGKYVEKTRMTTVYSERDLIPNIYALARVLDKKDHKTSNRLHNIDQIDIFLRSGIFLMQETRTQILSICNGF
jgi:hypothetical protein